MTLSRVSPRVEHLQVPRILASSLLGTSMQKVLATTNDRKEGVGRWYEGRSADGDLFVGQQVRVT